MASFAAEWAQVKREASAESGMRLASADGSHGPGGTKLSKAAWTAAANSVGLLKDDLKKARTALEQGQHRAGGNAEGVESAVAQREVYQSWKRYLDDVSGRCGGLQEPLEKAGHDEYKNDQAIVSAFGKLGDRYEDTPATGGQSRGR
ncbi:hypothetical protein ACFVWZ_05960 [Streptomyces sp. NPDC058200]|uniref:hypothetical protein n=1 Tax=Streptomyces sp. NPDC058200 TaxID=3346378 RepID=UPI0036E2C995